MFISSVTELNRPGTLFSGCATSYRANETVQVAAIAKLVKELQSLCLDIKVLDKDGSEIELKEEDEDDSIRNAINKFQVEVLMNFLIKYRESGAALPSIRFDDSPSAGEIRFAGAPVESCGALVK